MGEASDNGERFSCALLFCHIDASSRLLLSRTDANSPRLFRCTLEADAVRTGLVAVVPHIMEITMCVAFIASFLSPSQFVATT